MADLHNPLPRNIAIDYVKFMAVLLVMNSHMDICYAQYSFLSTGGILGDALFFFASGFGLLLGRQMRFDNWYKRRICRIYPSVIAASLVALVVWGFHEDIADVLLCKRYWFIGCILVYYVLLYPIKYFGNGKYLVHAFVAWLFVSILFYGLSSTGERMFYGGGFCRNVIFFFFVLQGALVGKYKDKFLFRWWHPFLMIGSLAIWAILCRVISDGSWLYLITVLPFLGFTHYTYMTLTAEPFRKFYSTLFGGNIVYIVSQLCLDIYLIQKFCYSACLNSIFPLNIPIFMLVVIAVAYIVKILAEIILQAFSPYNFDWKKLLVYKKQ